MARKLVIFGTAKFGELAHFYFTKDSLYEVDFFTEDADQNKADRFCGLPVIPFEEIEEYAPQSEYDLFVAVGYTDLNRVREKKCAEVESKGYNLASYLSSKAIYWGDTQIGKNTFILENNNLQPFMKIGDGTLIWSGCHFGHDVQIGNFCFFSSHVVVCGDVKIGNNCFVGGNTFIRNDLKIGDRCILGAQSVILNDVAEGKVFVAKETETFRLNSEQFTRLTRI